MIRRLVVEWPARLALMPFRKARRLGAMIGVFENWPLLVWHRFDLPSGASEVVYRLRNGIRVTMAPGRDDALVISEVWLGRPYEADPSFTVRPGWQVIDCGAHKGVFTLLSGSKGSNVRVVAVEPGPVNLEMLRANIEGNALANVTVVEAALSSRCGEGFLELKHSPGHTLVDAPVEGKTVPVKLIDLTSLLSHAVPPIDLVKLDIEGAEYDVFGNLPSNCLDEVRRMIVKCHARDGRSAGDGAEPISHILAANGFECNYVTSSQMVFAHRLD